MTASPARAPRRRSSSRMALLAALTCAALAACTGERELVGVQFSFMNGTWAGLEYTLPQGETFWTQPYAVYSDGTTEPVHADWTESVPSVVKVVPTGSGMTAVTGLAPGATLVTATYRGARGEIPLRVY